MPVTASPVAQADLGTQPESLADEMMNEAAIAGIVHRIATRCDELRFLDPTFSDFEGAFKTPSLRNVAQTGPYMHTGQFESLEAVIEHYRHLPGAARVGRRDPQLRPLGRSISTHDLAAFLRTLTGSLPEERWLSPP
mgnify:FL=1